MTDPVIDAARERLIDVLVDENLDRYPVKEFTEYFNTIETHAETRGLPVLKWLLYSRDMAKGATPCVVEARTAEGAATRATLVDGHGKPYTLARGVADRMEAGLPREHYMKAHVLEPYLYYNGIDGAPVLTDWLVQM